MTSTDEQKSWTALRCWDQFLRDCFPSPLAKKWKIQRMLQVYILESKKVEQVPGELHVPSLIVETFRETTWGQNQAKRFCLKNSSDSSAPLISLSQGQDDSIIRGQGKVNILPIMSHRTDILIWFESALQRREPGLNLISSDTYKDARGESNLVCSSL